MAGQRSKQEIWKEHITRAIHHPDGVSGYCRETGINASGFYQWRKKLKTVNPQVPTSAFVPLIASPEVPVKRGFLKSENSIDARWVGEMLASFVRGLL